MLMDDVCAIFDLASAPEGEKVTLIKMLMKNGKMNQAVTYTWKLNLQKHFDLAEVRVYLCM